MNSNNRPLLDLLSIIYPMEELDFVSTCPVLIQDYASKKYNVKTILRNKLPATVN